MKLLDAFIMGYGSQVTIYVYWPLVCKNFINSFFSQLKLVIMDIFNSRRIIFIGRHHNNASQKKIKLKLIVNVSLITYIKKKLQSHYHRPFVYNPVTVHVYHVKSNTFPHSVRFVPSTN